MPAGREWVTPSSAKKKKVKFSKPASSIDPSRGTTQTSTSGKPAAPITGNNPFSAPGEKTRLPSGSLWETEEKTQGDPIHPVEEPSPPGKQQVTTSPPNPDEEEGEVTPCDADIPDSIARALLDALQEKQTGNQLPAAMRSLARIRASQLQQRLAAGSEPTEAVIQAALDLIAVGQGPADPLALAEKVYLVYGKPDT